MRKALGFVVLIITATAILIFTESGHHVLSAFGVPMTECTEARLLWTLGFQVPQCTCGNCSPEPPTRPESSAH
jgi:hypothetical protein